MSNLFHEQKVALTCTVETKENALTVILGNHSVTKEISGSVLEICSGIENFSEAVRQRIGKILTMDGFDSSSFSEITINGQIEKEIKECQGKIKYPTYKTWAKERGIEPLDIMSFVKGLQGESIIKRFRWIRKNKMTIGSKIRFECNKKIHTIVGFTPDCQIIFDKTKVSKSPIKYNVVI